MPVGPSTTVARANGYHFDTFLSSPFEFVVMSRAVNMASIPNPLQALTFDNPYSGSGAYTDVQEGMEIIVYAGNTTTERGRMRVAAGGSTSTVIQVNEVSDTRIPIQDNDKFDVLLSFRLRDKLIGATETFPKDSRLAYTTQNNDVAPLANDGGHYAAVWRGSNIAVTFYGNLTLPVDFNSNGPFTHAWTVYGPDSLTVAFTSSAENPTFTFTAAGTYWVRHIATDTDVSASWTKWSAVVLDSNPIPIVIDGGISSHISNPTRLRFQAHANAGTDRLANGAMLLLHEDESIGSFGNRVTDRSRMKFVGYLTQHSLHIEPLTGQITFEALSPLGILNALPGFSQALQQVAGTPGNWQEYEPGLTTNAILVYLLRWHTTYADLFDVVLPNYNYFYADAFIQQQTPAGQLAEIAASVEAFARCDPSGALIQRQDLNKVGTTERDAAAVLYTYEETDFLDVDLEQAHRSDLAQLIGRGFAGDAPLESVAGDAPDEGGEFTSEERKIVLAQEGIDQGLNERTGWAFAFRKRSYNGVPVWVLRGKLPGSYDWISTAYDQWVKVTLSREVDGRTVTLTNARMWVESVDVQYEAVEDEFGTVQYDKNIDVVFIGETDGRKGKTRLPLTEEQNGLSDFDDPWIEFPQPVFDPSDQSDLVRGNANIALVSTTGLTYPDNFHLSSPAWASESWLDGSALDLLDASETVAFGVQKPGTPRTLHTATTTKARIFTNILQGTTVGLTYALRGTSSLRIVQTERGDPNICYILTNYSDGFWSEGHISGSAITTNRIGANVDMTGTYPGVFVDPNNPLIAYTVAYTGSVWRLHKTVDGGLNWSVTTDYAYNTVTTYEWDGAGSVPAEWWSSAESLTRSFTDPNVLYLVARESTGGAGARRAVLKLTSSTATIISPRFAAWPFPGWEYTGSRRGLPTLDSDKNVLMMASWRAGSFFGLFRTLDRGATVWDEIRAVTSPHNVEPSLYFGGDGSVYECHADTIRFHPNVYNLTDDSQFTDKTGTGYPGSGFVPLLVMGL